MSEKFYNWQEAHWDYLVRSYPLDDEFSLLTFNEYCLREYKKCPA